jgi:4-hydroxy-tetrahydrodipicolinate reductase
MADLKIVVTGAAGRMGGANIRAIAATPGLQLHAAIDRAGTDAIGVDAGTLSGLPASGILIGDDVAKTLEGADAIIDFTSPAATVEIAQMAAKAGLVHVIGTTGCSDTDEQAFHAAAKAGARIVKSGNMSLGVNLLASLVKKAAAALGPEFDIEIVEMHHNRKVDAPSGTALLLGEAAAKGRNIDLASHSVRVRDGITGPREEGTIGFATLRGGTVVGDHSVIFAGPSERITLTHNAEDRGLFANGAVKAVLWAHGQVPGYYTMSDVLGLD